MIASRLLEVKELSVGFGGATALDAVDFHIDAGETLAIVGESGSGKSTAAMAVLGLLPDGAAVSGEARILGRDMIAMSEAQRRVQRGVKVGMVFQDPFTSLNPGMTIGRQVAESLIHHHRASPDEARERTLRTLGEVGLPDPAGLLDAYPHQLSGGMQQRALIASALICDPKLLVLDEPTTALDVTVEARILDLLDDIRRKRGLGMLFITHNLGVVNRIADRICVLYAGRVVETGAKRDVLAEPGHPYAKGLLASLPTLTPNAERRRLAPIPGRMPTMGARPQGCVFAPRCPFAEPDCERPQALQPLDAGRQTRCWKAQSLRGRAWPIADQQRRVSGASDATGGDLAVKDLRKTFRGAALPSVRWSFRFGLPWPRREYREIHAVDGVSLTIAPGQVLGLVGESGSGKSTLGLAIMRLLGTDGGRIVFEGQDVSRLARGAMREFRRKAQVVFQNPDSSLNPRRTVGAAIARAVALHTDSPRTTIMERVGELLERVGLPRSFQTRYPHQLSGGERQRVGIARALATRPSFILCDEPTSALDVSVQATILNVLSDLREEEGLSYLFISHDLSVVAHVSDRVAVMYAGRIVETGTTRQVLDPPHHPYTEALLSAMPSPDPDALAEARIMLGSEAPAPGGAVRGCRFHTRCPKRIGPICDTVDPPERRTSDGHVIACHIPLDTLSNPAPSRRTSVANH